MLISQAGPEKVLFLNNPQKTTILQICFIYLDRKNKNALSIKKWENIWTDYFDSALVGLGVT